MTDLAPRLVALDWLLALARDRVDADVVVAAEAVAAKAGQRLRLGADSTVVALAGATGSGKSSLFNALAGEDVSKAGMRRPTTGSAHAATWGDADAGPLLDWLEVRRRHAAGPDPALDGLVLLDLPDVDSVARRHRQVADRLLDRVDLLVWVLDPQKYADAALHDRYLAPLAGHADVLLVVLNQIDRLPERARAGCIAHLRELLASEGLPVVPVAAASAVTGEGVAELRATLASRVSARRDAVRRLAADLTGVAETFGDACGGASSVGAPSAGVREQDRDHLVAALADAAGADLVAAAVGESMRLRARRATGWPFTRWIARLRLDPARRLRLRDAPSELVRTSLPGPSAVQRARVDSALRQVADRAAGELPEPWPTVVRRSATSSRDELPDLLDRAVAGTDLGLSVTPRWWRVAGGLQWLFALAASAGALWLLVLFGVAWLQLPDPPMPHVGRAPVPTLLLGGGLLAGLLTSWIAARLAAVGARRRSWRVARLIRERVRQVAEDAVLAPVEAELAAHADLCRALLEVRGEPARSRR